MICTFFGHSDTTNETRLKTKTTIEKLILDGVRQYYVGNNGNFDYIVQSVLEELSQKYDINFTVVLSYINEKSICADQYYTIYPEGLERTPLLFAISKRNEWMIKKSNIAVCYVKHSLSNSHKWLEMAKKKGLKVINIVDL